jgi:short-subunit dehydrogenase
LPIDYRGTTALITGASSGLGAEFARQLAARGANLVLVARRAERLEALSAELAAAHGVTATVIPADLTEPRAGAALAADLLGRGLEVHTLVASAGFATHGPFEAEDGTRITEEIDLNVRAVVDVTHALFPQLLQHGRGALITVASTGAYQPVPLMAVYGATKAFVLSFTEALWYEAKGTGLRVLALSPGATATEFFDVAGADAQVGSMQPVSHVVALALRTLDRRNPPPSIVSGAANRVTAAAPRLLGRRATANVSGAVMTRIANRRMS